MKQLVYAAMAAAMTIGAVTPASAWTYGHCKVAQGTTTSTVSNMTIAKECHQWMIGEGMISKGATFEGKGKSWGDKYSDVHWRSLDDPHLIVNTKGKGTDGVKYFFQLDGNQALRTKELSKDAFNKFLDENGYTANEYLKHDAPQDAKLNDYYYTLEKVS